MLSNRYLYAIAALIISSTHLGAQSAGMFVRTGDMMTLRLTETATLLLDGRVLVAGGLGGDRRLPVESAELYDPATGAFTATGSMSHARAGHAATRLADGRILITGGYSGTEVEIYDPASGMFGAVGNMTSSRVGHAAILLNNGKVLITGGFAGSASDLASAEIYDPESGVFTSVGEMTVPRFNHKVTPLPDGTVLIVPGSDGADFATSEVYDPRSGAFSSLPFANSHGYVAATSNLLPNGRVLQTLQSSHCDVNTRFATLYDALTKTFGAAPQMNGAHCQQVSTALPDGTVLIVGSLNDGNDARRPIPTAEIYDIRSGSFSSLGGVLFGRVSPRATLLNNGSVLITGGYTPAELYVPALPAPALRLLATGGQPAILHADSHAPVSSDAPAKPGEALEIYLTGLIDESVIPPYVAMGGRFAEVLYFGNAPGFQRLNQINVRVPSSTVVDNIEVRVTYLDRSSNSLTIPVR